MTDRDETNRPPLLVSHATPIPAASATFRTYDPDRQLQRTEVDREWVDTIDIAADDASDTLVTEVRKETTDDN